MSEYMKSMIEGEVIDERLEISIVKLCQRCGIESEFVERLVAEGVIEPSRQEGETLYFQYDCVKRTRIVTRLRSDLGVNLAGAALALELIESIERLKAQLRLAEMVSK